MRRKVAWLSVFVIAKNQYGQRAHEPETVDEGSPLGRARTEHEAEEMEFVLNQISDQV